MSPSWKRSREAPLWRRLDPAEAGRVLGRCYGVEAGAEALLRAYLAERDGNGPAVRFWLCVHGYLAPAKAADRPAAS